MTQKVLIQNIFNLSTGRRLTAVSHKAKDIPPQSQGYDGVETSDENVPPSKPFASEKPNAGTVALFT